MSLSFQVPCVQCGRSLVVVAAWPLPTCDDCTGGTSPWEVRVGAERVHLDHADVRSRLLDGTLIGSDFVTAGGESTPIAAHAAFRTLFLTGHPDALPLRSPPSTGSRAVRRIAVMLGLGAALVAAMGAWLAPKDTQTASTMVADPTPDALRALRGASED